MIQPTFWPAHSPEVISLAEDEVPLGEERGADLAEAAVAAAALEAVLVPVHVQGLQQVPGTISRVSGAEPLLPVARNLSPVLDLLAAAGALLRAGRLLRFGLHGHCHFAARDRNERAFSNAVAVSHLQSTYVHLMLRFCVCRRPTTL